MSHQKPAVRLSTVLIVVVMAVSLSLTVGGERDSRYVEESALSVGFSGVQSLQVIDLDADGAEDLFVQSNSTLSVFDANGQQLWSSELVAPVATTMGDVNGDGFEDVVTFEPGGAVRAATSGNAQLWSTTIARLGSPARAAVIRFNPGAQVVLGDADGQVMGLSGADGRLLWATTLSGSSEVRGLDDVLVDGDRLLVAADRGGLVAMFDAEGDQLWSSDINGLRRMRTFDVDGDGNGEVYFGGEQGAVFVTDEDGGQLWSRRVAQQVVEIRDGELDGDPTSREIVVGGRAGGVSAFLGNGTPLWATSVGARVSDITTVDLDDDGADETVVGDEGGGLTIFTGVTGERFGLDDRAGGVTALDEGRLSASDQVVVSSGNSVAVLNISRQMAPIFYSPLVAGLLLSMAIAAVGLVLARLPEKVPNRVILTDKSPEGLLARRRMLFENISDVEELRAQGEIGGQAALAKLESLRGQLAETSEALRKEGVGVAPEAMKCPSCGGRVRLGQDQCDYCGEVVIA